MSKSKFDGSDISAIEQRIENGQMFEISDIVEIANAGAVQQWLHRTGPNKQVLIEERQIVSNGDDLTFQVFNSPTVTADGDPVDVNNRISDSGIENETVLFRDPTVTDNGTPIPPVYMPGASGVGQSTVGQFNLEGLVRILQANTDYLLTITNNGAANPATTQLYILWAELTDPNPK